MNKTVFDNIKIINTNDKRRNCQVLDLLSWKK